MSSYTAHIEWRRAEPAGGDDFRRGRYSRAHRWTFDGGVEIPASPSPHVVRAPWSDDAAVDPEEALVAAISSCHMLSFLYCASRAGYEALSYVDDAVGTMAKNDAGKLWVNRVELHPDIGWVPGKAPSATELAALHHAAHDECFIAHSVRTEIEVVAPARG